MLSELALTGEVEKQLKLYQPRLFEPFYKPNPKLSRSSVMKPMLDTLGRMIRLADHIDEMPLANVGQPVASRFNYREAKERTKETVDHMRLGPLCTYYGLD
jgi:hypothetical protein